MKRTVCLLVLCVSLMMCAVCASAEAAVWYTGQVCDSLPMLTLTVTETGERTEEMEHTLQVVIEAQDGSLRQTVTWESIESPAFERIVPMVQMTDMNFDGFRDLVLLSAQGVRNVFCALSLWDVEEGRFRPVETGRVWDSQTLSFSAENCQLELCNYELYPQERRIFSSAADGYRFRTDIVYEWEGRYGLSVKAVADVYDAGHEMIGETVLLYGTGMMRCWNEAYPEEWYYGQEGVAGERARSIREVILGRALQDPVYLRVANTDWVNLRRQDSKASPSLARLDAGKTVMMLADACGPEGGWVRVWVDPEDGSGLFTSQPDDGSAMLTGYIWRSFLEAEGL